METVDAVRTRHAGAYFDDYPIPPIGFRSDLLRSYTNYLLEPPVSLEPVIDYLTRNPDEPVPVKQPAGVA